MTNKNTAILDLLDQAEGNQGLFGAVRKHDVHTGTDLYCPVNTIVRAIESGKVVWGGWFTGERAKSPWWNETQAIMVEGASGVILYGELSLKASTPYVERGQILGLVRSVLKHDKGKPMSMLHLELYEPGTTECVWWHLGEPQPQGLLDSTEFLRRVPNPEWNLNEVLDWYQPRPGDLQTNDSGTETYFWLKNEPGAQVITDHHGRVWKGTQDWTTRVLGIRVPLKDDDSGEEGPCLLVEIDI